MPFVVKMNHKETENKTIRFTLELIQRIELAIRDKDVSFSGFVIQACQYALDTIEDDRNEE